ncbi:hypothetical protein [Dyadobacter luticola]|uniref:Uncharacterized protein n=1 Tax=Dyadobacter luticola TaxID=1979387 RepID=A0A5R9KTM6_9BACT|nr:hypothetical protein [Dyadobacter luticola]TLU99517.1 hypothetical protein FEN17_23460 [Dyadobacter luticola]
MKIIFEAEAEGLVPLKKTLEMKLYPRVIRFVPNDENSLEKVSIEREIKDYDHLLPQIIFKKDRNPEMYIPMQNFSEEEMLMQHIESFAALDFGLRKIYWQTPRITWVPETEDEKVKITMPTYKRSFQYNLPKSEITLTWLQETVVHRDRVMHLVSPLSFFRIGSNHFHNFGYSEAFLNFYLMLEGLFGNGQSKNHKVENAFENAPTLMHAISETVLYLDNDTEKNTHKSWMVNFLQEKGWKYDNLGIIKAIICIRGNLSHYYFKSSRKQRDSFNEKENESIAWITMTICVFSTIKLRLDPFRAGGNQ